jgi:solute carrier family 25 folate transporter 32
LGTTDHLLAGVEAGIVMVCVTNPIWLVKTRLQLQVNGEGQVKHYRGFFDAMRTILKEDGPVGLYRGFWPAIFLTSHGAIQFAFYEEMKYMYREFTGKDVGKQPAWVSMGIGGISKIVAATATYPYQVCHYCFSHLLYFWRNLMSFLI